MNELITLTIPVYNAEKYLDRCMSSVLAQTYKALEIIIVDDGSTDSSPAMCDAWAEKDPRIRVIHQKNMGLSGARNTGIDNASGDILAFLDSDDEMLPEMIEVLAEAMEKTGADISFCAYQEIFPGKNEADRRMPDRPSPVVFTGDDKFDLLMSMWGSATVQWNKLFRKKIFNDLRYPLGKYHEDEFVAHLEYLAADKVCYTPLKLYIYYRNEGSITQTRTMRHRLHALEAFYERLVCFDSLGLRKAALGAYRRLSEILEYTDMKACSEQFDDFDECGPPMKAIEDEVKKRYRARYGLAFRFHKLNAARRKVIGRGAVKRYIGKAGSALRGLFGR